LHADQGAREFGGKTLRERPEEPFQGCGLGNCHGQKLVPNAVRSEQIMEWPINPNHEVLRFASVQVQCH